MVSIKVALVLCLVCVSSAFVRAEEEQSRLKGSKVYNIYINTKEQAKDVYNLEQTLPGVDFWQHGYGPDREARVWVPEELLAKFEETLSSYGVQFEVSMTDLETIFENEMKANMDARSKVKGNSKITFELYYNGEEINAYLDELAIEYNGTVTVRTLGQSYEGRNLKGIVISSDGGTNPNKPVFIVDAGIHAREWIGPSVALYMIHKLVEDITEQDLADEIDWVIIPVLNPDGYAYTHSSSANRSWRKTRTINVGSSCMGVDANRNFDFQWLGPGGSTDPCSSNYAGRSAFSEPEARILRDIFEEYRGRSKAYLAIHSQGSLFLYPYGYNAAPTLNDAVLGSLGTQIGAAINAAIVPGSKEYVVGNIGVVLYMAAGITNDYAYERGEIPLSYVIEMPGGGPTGYDPPSSQIRQLVEEAWAGFIVWGRHVIANQK